jgi:hypothetical protein
MPQNPMSVEAIRQAYDIAWAYLDRTGVIEDEEKAHYRLLATMIEAYNKGGINKLILANKAIVAFQQNLKAAA